MKLIQLPQPPPKIPEPIPEVVELVEHLRTLALSGHITTLAVVAIDSHTGETLSCMTGKIDCVRVLGALEYLKHRIAHTLRETEPT